MNAINKVYLHLSSWAGHDPRAYHISGKLYGYVNGQYKTVELDYTMNEAQATEANRRARELGETRLVARPGKRTSLFESIEDALACALAVWQKHYPDGQILSYGWHSFASIQPCTIVYPAGYEDASSALVEEMKTLYGGRPDPRSWDEYDEINRRYDALLAQSINGS